MSKIDYSELKQLAAFLRDEKMKRIRVMMDDTEIELEAPTTETVIAPAAAKSPALNADNPPQKKLSGIAIESPMIGTAYLSSEPGVEPFVKVGSKVKPGQVVCIIEAMKMFTKIKSEVSGTITQIHIHTEDPVDFAQPFFQVDEHV